MKSSYAAVLRTPHASRTFGFALLGRLSYGTVYLSLTLALTASTGSYAQAGGLLALFGLTVSVLSPVRAALIDRHGPRRTLPPMAASYALVLAAFAVLTSRPGAPVPLLTVLAVTAGVTAPPIGVVMRTLWSALLPDGPLLRRAYSLDTVSEELVFVTGPLLAGLLAAVAAPSLGVALGAVLIAAGTAGMVTSPAAPRPRAHPRTARVRVFPLAPVVAAVATGVVLGSTGLLAVAFTQRHHQPAAVAWVEAALAVGSTLGGLAYGALSRSAPGRARLGVLACPLGLGLAAAGLAPSVAVLAAMACAAGLFVGPTLTTAYLLADADAPPGARTRAVAWVNTALNLGASGGTAATGAALDALPLPACYAVAAAPAVLVPLVLLVLPKRQRSSRPGGGGAHDRSMDDTTHQEYWDTRYSEHHHMWSGEPNAVLVQEAADLAPGTALDLGCGEGADAVWLARRGWRVTAVDISGVALERAAYHAEEARRRPRRLAAPRPGRLVPRGFLRPGLGAVPALPRRHAPRRGPAGRCRRRRARRDPARRRARRAAAVGSRRPSGSAPAHARRGPRVPLPAGGRVGGPAQRRARTRPDRTRRAHHDPYRQRAQAAAPGAVTRAAAVSGRSAPSARRTPPGRSCRRGWRRRPRPPPRRGSR
ncbi:MFS transporter [Actinomadura luteofluorescens]|uniref:MFS transporter n=1 Tax=Actinomadura luteofluorescens TaxID=46163 RepID=UPI0036315E89